MENQFSFLQRSAGPPAKGQTLALCGRAVTGGKREGPANFLVALWPQILRVGLALCMGMIFHQTILAQCSNGLSAHTYDTTLSSNGFGMFTINAPQWSPDSGTLVSVKLSATVSSQYGFTLTNADTHPATYSLTLGQDDQISGGALSSPFSSIMSQLVNTYPLTAGQAVTLPPFAFLNNHVSSDSITGNVAPFLGFGRVTLNYLSFTYTDLSTVNNATYSYSANINNNIKFSVQYLYCTGGNAVLPASLTRFSAALTGPHKTGLSWAAVNETANRVYDIQRSRDGSEFSTISSITAQGDASGADYDYIDHLEDTISGNVFYRLQIHDQEKVTWSAIQHVDVAGSSVVAGSTTGAATGPRVYPNPATSFINLATGQQPNDWQVDIIAANGNVVLRTQSMQSSTIYIPFSSKLSPGTYFARLTGLRGQQGFSTSFVVIPNN